MQGHDVVSQVLNAEGLGTVFTLVSEGTMRLMSTLEEEWDESIRMVKTRHEQGAVAMADWSGGGQGSPRPEPRW
jgi:thiamine pyrophosphate-dependent acetolactate synthase large subunit-like protein